MADPDNTINLESFEQLEIDIEDANEELLLEEEPLLQLALLDMDDTMQLANLDMPTTQTPYPDSETNDIESNQGFASPHPAHQGSEGLVQSVPRDLNNLPPDFKLSFNRVTPYSNQSLSGLFNSFLKPEFFPPPGLTVAPDIQINDTLINHEKKALFHVQLDEVQISEVTVNFSYPEEVTILGGSGVLSFDEATHTGVLRIPAGTTSVTIETQVKPGYDLLNQQFQIGLTDDQEGLTPHFIKPIGTAYMFDGQHDVFASDDVFWTTFADTENNYNLVFMLDVSASMNSYIKKDLTLLDQAKRALVEFLEFYQEASDNLNITIIPFAAGDANQGAFAYHATDVQDAIDFVQSEGAHQGTGIDVYMINPNTGEALGRGTHYNDALYHGRVTLESDLVNPDLSDYAHKVYFISDGVPNAEHAATDQQDWPDAWSSWQSFIADPQQSLGTVFSNDVDVYGVRIGDDPRIEIAMQPIVSNVDEILSADAKLDTLSQQLLTTVPEYFQANLLANDMASSGVLQVTDFSFQSSNPGQFIQDHHLQGVAQVEGNTIHIPVPMDGKFVQMETPLGGKLWVNSHGDLLYLSPNLNHDDLEQFDYKVYNPHTGKSDDAHIDLNIIGHSTALNHLQGNNSDNTLSSTGLDGIVVMEGSGGDNTFVVNMQGNAEQVYIRDLFANPDNTLVLLNPDNPSSLTLNDVFVDVFQPGPFEALEFTVNNSDFTLVLDNPVDYLGGNLNEALDYLQSHVHIEIM